MHKFRLEQAVCKELVGSSYSVAFTNTSKQETRTAPFTTCNFNVDLYSYLSLWLLGITSVNSPSASSQIPSYNDTNIRNISRIQRIARRAWQNDLNRSVCVMVFASQLSDDGSDLAWDSARLQETLMDGVLQKLLVIVGYGCVSATSSTMVTGGHLKH